MQDGTRHVTIDGRGWKKTNNEWALMSETVRGWAFFASDRLIAVWVFVGAVEKTTVYSLFVDNECVKHNKIYVRLLHPVGLGRVVGGRVGPHGFTALDSSSGTVVFPRQRSSKRRRSPDGRQATVHGDDVSRAYGVRRASDSGAGYGGWT